MRPSRVLKIVLVNIAVILLVLFLIEGMVSYITIGHAFFTQRIAERRHTEYDPELGWINLPNVHIENMYSREDPLTTNSQRYRGVRDFSAKVPAGKIRIVCSGDSFTLGFGVDDDHTWCQQLVALDGRLETVNMGQGGYGVDQAYLWYMRDQQQLEHDVVVFAFIKDDFYRMESDTFMGYGKPYLSVRDGELVQVNYPVPRQSYDASWLAANLHMWRELDTSKWLAGTFGGVFSEQDVRKETSDPGRMDAVVAKIFSNLQKTSLDNHRHVVLVYLPTRGDLEEPGYNRWEWLVGMEAEKQGYHYLNIADEMRTLPPGEAENMFRKGGHYTDEGNRYVAEMLLPEIVALAESGGGSYRE